MVRVTFLSESGKVLASSERSVSTYRSYNFFHSRAEFLMSYWLQLLRYCTFCLCKILKTKLGDNLIIFNEPEGNNCTVVQVLSNSAVNFFCCCSNCSVN